MFSKLLNVSLYVVRVTGLFFAGAMAVTLAGFSLLGESRSLIAAAGCAWVTAAVVLSWPRLPDAWRRDPPSERQIAYATNLGIRVTDGMSKGQLSDLISQAKGR